MIRFLVDNQLPEELADWLAAKGCRGEHVLNRGLGQASDLEIWRVAAQESAVIVTKDEDFSRLLPLRPEAVTVVWLRMGNCRKIVLLATMERMWPAVRQQIDSGSRLIEVY